MTEVPVATCVADEPEEQRDRLPAQRGGGLVEDEQRRGDRERLGDLQQVPLGHGQRVDPVARVDLQADVREQPPGHVRSGSGPEDLGRQGDLEVLLHGQVRQHGRVLVDDRDPAGGRLPRGERGDGLPADRDRAGVGDERAGGDVHQRRLAGAVLAEDRVHLAGQHAHRDVGQGRDAAEVLGDAGHLQRGRACRRDRRSGHQVLLRSWPGPVAGRAGRPGLARAGRRRTGGGVVGHLPSWACWSPGICADRYTSPGRSERQVTGCG